MEQITILGATGSIGTSTLDVIGRHPDKYTVFALSGNSNIAKLADQCEVFEPSYAVVMTNEAANDLTALLRAKRVPTEVLWGKEALCSISNDSHVDIVMASIAGSIGLKPTLAAVEAGKKVLLANKESLVMAGGLFMDAVKRSECILLPIDSEHNALFQCLPRTADGTVLSGVSRLLLSASGGPFRGWDLKEMEGVNPEQACAHPKWSMGRKISVDSATLMNKGLEVIEACWLFNISPDKVDVVVHPESIIHSLVQYIDGSVLAQLGNPDMRTPIAHGLAWPERINSGVDDLNLFNVANLNFERPDPINFPCIELAFEAARVGMNASTILNASNEVAVGAFLDGRIGFTQIANVVEETLTKTILSEPESLDAVQESDAKARFDSRELISQIEG
jgi:1-deoxy-D-xylulose-5-phosphate reductoisomerase